MSSAFYQRRICKGLCLQLDQLGLCMGLCTTEPSYVQKVYDHAQKKHTAQGKPFEVIPYYAEQAWRNEALLSWLDGSVTQPSNGKPQRFYLSAGGSVQNIHEPIWCATTPEGAMQQHNHFSDIRPGGDNIMPVYIKSKAPLRLHADLSIELSWDQTSAPEVDLAWLKQKTSLSVFELVSTQQGQELLRTVGFDAVCVEGKNIQWLILEPAHVKSALGNSGRYQEGVNSLTDRPQRQEAQVKPSRFVGYCGNFNNDTPSEPVLITQDPNVAYEQCRQHGAKNPQIVKISVELPENFRSVTAREWTAILRRSQHERSLPKALQTGLALRSMAGDGVWLPSGAMVKIEQRWSPSSFLLSEQLIASDVAQIWSALPGCLPEDVSGLTVQQQCTLVKNTLPASFKPSDDVIKVCLEQYAHFMQGVLPDLDVLKRQECNDSVQVDAPTHDERRKPHEVSHSSFKFGP